MLDVAGVKNINKFKNNNKKSFSPPVQNLMMCFITYKHNFLRESITFL